MAVAAPKPGSVFTWDYWDSQPPPFIQLSCMMPNSIFLTLNADRSMTLATIKEILWTMAMKKPLREQLLGKSDDYVFQYVNRLATHQEVTDESIRLSELRPVGGVLRLQRRRLDAGGVEALDGQIGFLIGKNLREFDALKNDEVDHFRAQINAMAQENADTKLNMDRNNLTKRLLQLCPNRITGSDRLPVWLEARLGDYTKFRVVIECEELAVRQHGETSLSLNVAHKTTPRKLLERILHKSKDRRDTGCFLLKVCGQSEYLTRDDYPLIRFVYIQEMLARNATPKFVIVLKETVLRELERDYKVSTTAFATSNVRKLSCHTTPSWKIREPFRCTVLAVSKLNIDFTKLTDVEVEVQAGIFHSGKKLCEHLTTCRPDLSSLSKGVVRWTQELLFSILVCDIPRMARLCLVVIESKMVRGSQTKKNKRYRNPLAWVNTTIYEYNNRLKTEETTMYMWAYPDHTRTTDLLYPLGTVALNPNADQSVTITIRYGQYTAESPIAYAPNPELTISVRNLSLNCSRTKDNLVIKIHQMKLNPFYEMHEQDWKDLWEMRMYLPQMAPELLPKLLQCAEWGNPENVACVNYLLNSWPSIRVECALELLDYGYAEPAVRHLAVKTLKNLPDDQLSLYLLQLIQALKHESYLMCDLAQFLLKRAYQNLKIGHFMFWQLKSEMHNSSVNIRFGLMLEGYLRGSRHHMPALLRQVNCLQKLIDISKMLKQRKDIESARADLQKYLSELNCRETITQFANTLNPSFQCSRIIPTKCRVMDSKMRPMLLVFKNSDKHGEDIRIILKNGDDLRQDMFTLQMMRIMDQLWKEEGYDFRLNPYGCISIGHKVGMIEVVLEAHTIASIQKERGCIGLKSDSILPWLKEHNPDESDLKRAIEEFMLSCAGYCVATYVMGVADRHSDNIMVKKNGQLFHIDFGHILGHFKEKFGFRRERVPFVLAHEFVNVINGGIKNNKEFDIFRKLCEDAYMVLRRHGMLIVSLFSMMISTGLPELSSEEDVMYLRETLALEATDNEAKARFHSKFDEALRNDFYTMVNWWVHNIAKNN